MSVHSIFIPYKRMGILLAILFELLSCRTDYFTKPLPVDAPDLTITPVSLRGTYRFADESDTMEVQLLKRSIIVTQKAHSTRFVKGYWPERSMDHSQPELPLGYTPEFEIQFDSLQQHLDTVCHFLIHNNLLYPVKHSDFGLKAGLEFQRDGDTLITMGHDITSLDLGRNAFFRRVSKDCFVLNLNSNQWSEEPGWWFLYMITVEEGGLQLRDILPDNSDSLKLHFYQDNRERAYMYYFDLSWTVNQMQQKRASGEFPAAGRFERIR